MRKGPRGDSTVQVCRCGMQQNGARRDCRLQAIDGHHTATCVHATSSDLGHRLPGELQLDSTKWAKLSLLVSEAPKSSEAPFTNAADRPSSFLTGGCRLS